MNALRKRAIYQDARSWLGQLLQFDATINAECAEVGDPFRLLTNTQRTALAGLAALLDTAINRITAKLEAVTDD